MGEEQVRSSKVTPGSMSGQVWSGLVRSGQVRSGGKKKFREWELIFFNIHGSCAHTSGPCCHAPSTYKPPFFLFLFQG
jgi:hypothetical protein